MVADSTLSLVLLNRLWSDAIDRHGRDRPTVRDIAAVIDTLRREQRKVTVIHISEPAHNGFNVEDAFSAGVRRGFEEGRRSR